MGRWQEEFFVSFQVLCCQPPTPCYLLICVVSRVMSNQLQKITWMISVALILVNAPVLAEDSQKQISKFSQLRDAEKPATNIQQWLAQSLIQVTGVKSQATDKGIEVTLETNQSDKLQLVNKSEGNSYW